MQSVLRPFSPLLMLLIVSVFITVVLNQSFFSALIHIYPISQHLLFDLAVAILLGSLIYIVALIFNYVLPVKVVACLLLLIASSCAYFADQFGVVISVDMIRNGIQTDSAEAFDLVSWGLIGDILLYGGLPAMIVAYLPLTHRTASVMNWRRCLTQSAVIVLVLLGNIGVVWLNGTQFASFIRQHKAVRYYANPLTPIHSAIKYGLSNISHSTAPTFLSIASYAQTPKMAGHKELIVLVVGETARADHFTLNGYQRNTTPKLSAIEEVISFTNVTACGTSTAISVPCMFAQKRQSEFDTQQSKYIENALDVVAKAGVSVLWRDNNSDSKGVALRVDYENFRDPKNNPICDIECRDVGMLEGLQAYIEQQPGDILIVLHQMGSHGPAYYKRYPAEFEMFTPSCQSAELSECTNESIVNAYDNSIYYTDYFLSRVIELLKANTPEYETTMLYVSDHGESLGENGVYLHGMPYTFAPKSQTHVPVLAWVGASSDVDFNATTKIADKPVSHDAVFESILSLFEIQSDAYPQDSRPMLIMREEY